jgi:5'-AMP-activated protein kinase regulatory beta subunit
MGNSSSQEEEARRAQQAASNRQRSSSSSNSPSVAGQKRSQQQQQQQQSEDEGIPNVRHNFDEAAAVQDIYSNPLLPKPPTTTTSTTTQVFRESSFEQTPEFSHVEKVPEQQQVPARPGMGRTKSAIVLETEHDNEVEEELERMKLTEAGQQEPTTLSRANSGEEVDLVDHVQEEEKFDTRIVWKQGGSNVYVTGSFTNWRKMIRLTRQENGEFATILKLPAGTHRMRFLVDNELRCSDYLPSATDSMGNLVNYIEVGDEQVSDERPSQRPRIERNAHSLVGDEDDDDLGENYERLKDDESVVHHEPEREYGTEIPQVFTNPEVMDKFVSSDFVTPPVLPPHLEGVILNSDSTEKDNNSILPIPNHVVLNHLATTSIKHNVLAVASISRYSRKYVTQVLYAPLQ